MASISDILIAKGNAQANAASQRGNIYADLIRNLSSLPGQFIQQQRQGEKDAMRRQQQQQQIDLSRSEQDLQRQRLAQGADEAKARQTATARQSSIDAVLGSDVWDENGYVDIGKVREKAAASDPSLVPHAVAVAQKLNQQTDDWRESQTKAESAQLALAAKRNDAIGMAGLELMSGVPDVDQGSYELAIGQFVKHKLVDPQQAEAWLNAKTPAERKANVAAMVRGSKEASAMLAKPPTPKVSEHDPEKSLVDETGKVLIPAVSGVSKPETRSLDVQAAEALKRGDMDTYKQLLKVKKEMGQADNVGAKEPIVQIMDPNGSPIWVRQSDAVGKPAAQAPRAVTGAERGTLAFYNRAKEAVDTLTSGGDNSLENKIAKSNIVRQGQLKYLGNALQTEDQQQYRQAQRAFTEARLRKESGAAIPLQEFENDWRTYFAQPGDGPDTIKQKEKARQTVLDGLKFSAGKAYDEYYGEPNVSPARSGKSGNVGKYTFTVE